MSDLRKAAEMVLEALEDVPLKPTEWSPAVEALRQALAMEKFSEVNQEIEEALKQPKREWVGLSYLDKTFLRTAYAQLRPLYHDNKEDVSVAAEVVTDWDGFFAAINDMLKEKNGG